MGKALHLGVLIAKKKPAHSFSNARVVVKFPGYGCQLSCEKN